MKIEKVLTWLIFILFICTSSFLVIYMNYLSGVRTASQFIQDIGTSSINSGDSRQYFTTYYFAPGKQTTKVKHLDTWPQNIILYTNKPDFFRLWHNVKDYSFDDLEEFRNIDDNLTIENKLDLHRYNIASKTGYGYIDFDTVFTRKDCLPRNRFIIFSFVNWAGYGVYIPSGTFNLPSNVAGSLYRYGVSEEYNKIYKKMISKGIKFAIQRTRYGPFLMKSFFNKHPEMLSGIEMKSFTEILGFQLEYKYILSRTQDFEVLKIAYSKYVCGIHIGMLDNYNKTVNIVTGIFGNNISLDLIS